MKGVVNITMEMFKPQSTGMFSTIHILAKLLNRFSLEASLTWTGRRLYCRSALWRKLLEASSVLGIFEVVLGFSNSCKACLVGRCGVLAEEYATR